MSNLTLTCCSSNNTVFMQDEQQQTAMYPEAKEHMFARMVDPQVGEMNTGDAILPAGVRYVESEGNVTIVMYEFAPRLWNFTSRIYVNDSGNTEIRRHNELPVGLRLSLPYVLLTVPIIYFKRQGYCYAGLTQCVFLKEPFRSFQDQTFIATLPNTARNFGPGVGGHGANWLCTGEIAPYHLLQEVYTEKQQQEFKHSPRYISLLISELAKAFSARGFNGDLKANFYDLFASGVPGIYPTSQWADNSRRIPDFWKQVNWRTNNMTVGDVLQDTKRIVKQSLVLYCLDVASLPIYDRACNFVTSEGKPYGI